MVRSPLCLLVPAALALASGGLAAQGSFEGVVHYRMTGQGGQAMEPVFYIKGGKTRVEMNAGGQMAAILMDLESGAITALMPAQKMYITMNMGAMARNLPQGNARADADVKFEATGEQETIAGITCEHYRATQTKDDTQADLCLAKGMGMFMGVSMPAGKGPMGGMGGMGGMGSLPPGAKEFAKTFKDGAFLLKMDVKKSGKTEMSMVVTQLEKKSLDAGLFVPPSDYREMRMPG